MAILSWGAGGTQVGTFTSADQGGWYTKGLRLPTPRMIYDGTRPLNVVYVEPTAGSGNRIGYWSIGGGWQSTDYISNVPSGQTFDFLVSRISGTIYLALLRDGSYTTYDNLTHNPVNWNPNGPQPGQMVWTQAPSAPTVNSIEVTSSTSVVVKISSPSDNGDTAITGYLHQFATSTAFTTIVKEVSTVAGSSATVTVTGLPAGAFLYHRVMARNDVTAGVGKKGGAASATKSFRLVEDTLGKPTIAVAPAATGKSAQVTLTPPKAVNPSDPVKSWTVTAKPHPSGSTKTYSYTGTSGSFRAEPLTPGVLYSWSAVAKNNTTTSPVSNTVTIAQPNPSTNPGDYFDGNSPATPDVYFAWNPGGPPAGTEPNNAQSLALGFGAIGWEDFDAGATDSGGTGVVIRVTGGALDTSTSAFATRATFFTDAPRPGFHLGQSSSLNPGRSSVVGDVPYTGSIYVLVSRANRMAAEIRWRDTAGAVIGTPTRGDAEIVEADTWVRLHVAGDSPPDAVYAGVRAVDVAGEGHTNWRGGDQISADAAMLTLGETLYPYFDGATPDTSQYDFTWQGGSVNANKAPSLRNPRITAAPNPLKDPDCVAVPTPPRPPVILDDCIDVVPTWRRYWATIPASLISDWLTVLPTLELITGCNPDPVTGVCKGVRQVRIRTYPNPFDYPVGVVDDANWCAEQIVSYIPPNTTLTIDGPLRRVFAEVAGAAPIPADHLLYGTGGVPATWPELSCGIPYLMSFDVPLDAPENNFAPSAIYLTRRN